MKACLTVKHMTIKVRKHRPSSSLLKWLNNDILLWPTASLQLSITSLINEIKTGIKFPAGSTARRHLLHHKSALRPLCYPATPFLIEITCPETQEMIKSWDHWWLFTHEHLYMLYMLRWGSRFCVSRNYHRIISTPAQFERCQLQLWLAKFSSPVPSATGCITLPLYFFFSLVLLSVNTSTLTGVAIFISLIEE